MWPVSVWVGRVVSAAALVMILGLAGCQSRPADKAKGGASEAPAAVDWCAGHGVPESACTRCNPELIAGFKAKGDWCAEHGLPESQCRECNPNLPAPVPPGTSSLDPVGDMSPEGELAGSGHDPSGMCSEHRVLESECAICLPDLGVALDVVTGSSAQWPKVRLVSSESASRAGMRAVRAGSIGASSTVSGAAEILADEDRAARVTTPVDGTVRRLLVGAGERVRAGQVVVVLSSPEVGEARAAVDHARALADKAGRELARSEELFRRQLLPEREVSAARAEDGTARADLASEEARLSSLTGGAGPADSNDPSLLALKAPVAGELSVRAVRAGQAVEMGELLLEVVDRSRLWCDLSLGEAAAAAVRPGQTLVFQSEELAGQTFLGKVEAVIPAMEAASRTVRVRAYLDNAEEQLRPGLFGRAHVSVGAAPEGARLPAASLVRYSGRVVVFVRTAPDLFEVRPVKVGARDAEMVDVLAGVAPGEEIVTDGAFLLKTQVSKGSIGAGCCETVARLEK